MANNHKQGVEVNISTKADTSGIDKVNTGLGGLGKKVALATTALAGVATAIAGAFAGVAVAISKTTKQLDNLHQVSERTGISAKKMRYLGEIAELNGGSFEDASQSLENFNKVVGEARAGVGRGALAFKQYGIELKKSNGQVKSTEELLAEVSNRMNSLDHAQSTALATKLGINTGLVQTLSKGNDELERLLTNKASLDILPDDAERISAEFHDNMTESLQILKQLGQFVAINVLPAINSMLVAFIEFRKNNQQLIKDIAIKTAGAFKILIAVMKVVASIVIDIIETLLWLGNILITAVKNPIGAVIVVMLTLIKLIPIISKLMITLNAIMAVNPILAIGMAILAVIILVKKAVDTILEQWGSFGEFFGELFEFIFSYIRKWKLELQLFIQTTVELFSKLWDIIRNTFIDGFNFILDWYSMLFDKMLQFKNYVVDLFTAPFKWLENKLGFIFGKSQDTRDMLNGLSTSDINVNKSIAGLGTSVNNNTSSIINRHNNTNATININAGNANANDIFNILKTDATLLLSGMDN